MRKLILFLITGMLWCNFGFAEVSVRGYNKLMASENKHDHNLADLIIDHIYAGLQTANAQLKQKKRSQFIALQTN